MRSWDQPLNGDMVSDIFLLLACDRINDSVRGHKNLRWSELDLERSIVTLGDTKTGVSVRPLSNVAIDIMYQKQYAHPMNICSIMGWKALNSLAQLVAEN